MFGLMAMGSLDAQAAWHLDYESSRLSFVTTRNVEVANVQRFLVLHGKVDESGAAELTIDLDSINSGVPLRDERMRRELFQVDQYPEATVQAQLDLAPILALAAGAQLEMRLPIRLSLHGQTQSYSAELLATRLDDRRFQVVTLEPLVIRAEDFGLAPGIRKLRELAGVKSISFSVPVGAVLIFSAR